MEPEIFKSCQFQTLVINSVHKYTISYYLTEVNFMEIGWESKNNVAQPTKFSFRGIYN